MIFHSFMTEISRGKGGTLNTQQPESNKICTSKNPPSEENIFELTSFFELRGFSSKFDYSILNAWK